ncbi:hypothetical protein E2C01_053846 [Portunus trituberculatus]|uniref:Uncharacterized protein n=1 Tax=Portunus trituberculatus TaxID=210409 RepID=A0A5B7GQA2_PORTR|nr:hypothetical protein [Portunus trituberculatus]
MEGGAEVSDAKNSSGSGGDTLIHSRMPCTLLALRTLSNAGLYPGRCQRLVLSVPLGPLAEFLQTKHRARSGHCHAEGGQGAAEGDCKNFRSSLNTESTGGSADA